MKKIVLLFCIIGLRAFAQYSTPCLDYRVPGILTDLGVVQSLILTNWPIYTDTVAKAAAAVTTNDTRQLDFTGADILIADATKTNHPVTKSQADLAYAPNSFWIRDHYDSPYDWTTNTLSSDPLSELDLRGIVPVGTKKVWLKVVVNANAVGRIISFFWNTNSAICNANVTPEVGGISKQEQIVVPVSANTSVYYSLNASLTNFVALNILVVGGE